LVGAADFFTPSQLYRGAGSEAAGSAGLSWLGCGGVFLGFLRGHGGAAAGEGWWWRRPGKAQPYRTAGAVGAGEWVRRLVGAADFFTPSQLYRGAGSGAARSAGLSWLGCVVSLSRLPARARRRSRGRVVVVVSAR
jgi:hypothetical protein